MWLVSKKPVQILSLAPFLHNDLMELEKGLILRCIETEVLEPVNTASELMKVDSEPIKCHERKLLFRTCCNFLLATTANILEKSI